MSDVIVIGAGFGGLAAAVTLAAAGRSVEVIEAGPRPGGKADEIVVDGLACDTGPTVLTLPQIAEDLFEAAGTRLADEITLVRPEPAFRYHYPDGTVLDVHHALDDTLVSVADALGAHAADQLQRHLQRARRIWEASADAFVFGPAPTIRRILGLGPRAWWSLSQIGAHRRLWDVICEDVSDERLRWLLARYATYNGSDVRTAPATLACIAWVELGLGAWGVQGGMHALAVALQRVAQRLGVVFSYDDPVQALTLSGTRVTGLQTRSGRSLRAQAVVCNADAAHLKHSLLPEAARPAVSVAQPPSTSGWVGLLRARPRPDRVAHEVCFPERYLEEFADLFDRHRTPVDPTVYTCALARAHGRGTWPDAEPVFAMINAPALGPVPDDAPWRARALARLRASGRIGEDDPILWERTPEMLEARFPDTRGAIYGAASSSAMAAFQRPPNRLRDLDGLFLAGGSAHPGGGVPLCLQSGRRAAEAILSLHAHTRAAS